MIFPVYFSLPWVLLVAFTDPTGKYWCRIEQLERRKRIANKIEIVDSVLKRSIAMGQDVGMKDLYFSVLG